MGRLTSARSRFQGQRGDGEGRIREDLSNVSAPASPVDLQYEMTPYGWVPTAVRARQQIGNAKRFRQRMANAYATGNAGAMGLGDRGYGNSLPYWTDNPYSSNDFVYRWRQEVMLYETSWEARKIVRIIPEDALRKDWTAEGIPEEMASQIWNRLERLQFLNVLKRSLMLERLLGGCLTFLGIEDDEDEPGNPYHPKTGSRLRFTNSIPISRIARVTWNFDPLSEGYMRPSMYLVNGVNVHVSRCLVWDGEPLFDPYDFALTNFRANLAGFGPSKLASVWDDIIKAIGTRQAAYQLIQTNNAILAAVEDLQDLQGTTAGQKSLEKIKNLMNQISVYRAGILDSEKVTLSQHSASFGSVPELLIMYLQVLSAASDIPATRFIGQSPGGLNATGESDMENYYNVIDAYQRQRIQPQLRRIYDVEGYSLFGDRWDKARKDLTFKFPPMWNSTELEEAQRNQTNIDNILKLVQDHLLTDEKAIEELVAKKAFSVKLDPNDMALIAELRESADAQEGPFGGGGPEGGNGGPEEAIQRLKNVRYFFGNTEGFRDLVRAAGGDPERFDPKQVEKGIVVEQEHFSTTGGDEVEMMRIVLDHLAERPDYYGRLEEIGNTLDLPLLKEPTESQAKAGNYPKHHVRLHGLDVSVENPKGSIRRGVGTGGMVWESVLPAHYGYVRRTTGADGDHVDAFIGPNEESDTVFVVDQINPETNAFDEHKCLLGFLDVDEARKFYAAAFSDGLGFARIGSIARMTMDEFKEWLSKGDLRRPCSQFSNTERKDTKDERPDRDR